jgi:hypothetical protein
MKEELDRTCTAGAPATCLRAQGFLDFVFLENISWPKRRLDDWLNHAKWRRPRDENYLQMSPFRGVRRWVSSCPNRPVTPEVAGSESRRSRSGPAASLSCVRRGWRPRTSLRHDSRVRFVCRETRHTHSVRWTHLLNEEMLRSIQAQLDDGEVATPRAEGSAISLDAAVEQSARHRLTSRVCCRT